MIRGTTSLLGFTIKICTKHNKGTTLCWGGGGVKGEVVPGPLFYTFLFLHPSLSQLFERMEALELCGVFSEEQVEVLRSLPGVQISPAVDPRSGPWNLRDQLRISKGFR